MTLTPAEEALLARIRARQGGIRTQRWLLAILGLAPVLLITGFWGSAIYDLATQAGLTAGNGFLIDFAAFDGPSGPALYHKYMQSWTLIWMGGVLMIHVCATLFWAFAVLVVFPARIRLESLMLKLAAENRRPPATGGADAGVS